MLISGAAAHRMVPVQPVNEPVRLRSLSDQELQAAHRQVQRELVFGRQPGTVARLNAIERELIGRSLPCR